MAEYRIDSIHGDDEPLYAVMRNSGLGWHRVTELSDFENARAYMHALATSDLRPPGYAAVAFVGFVVGVIAGLLAGLLVANEQAADERAKCQRRIENLTTKPISPAPNLMMQKLKCVDRDLKTYGAPCALFSLRPYYQDASVTLYHGDALEILPKLGKAGNGPDALY